MASQKFENSHSESSERWWWEIKRLLREKVKVYRRCDTGNLSQADLCGCVFIIEISKKF